jgi:hypothetical protein
MEFHELELALKYLSGTGLTLSIAEVTGLTAGLTRLKQNEQYASIYLWGKCLGAPFMTCRTQDQQLCRFQW